MEASCVCFGEIGEFSGRNVESTSSNCFRISLSCRYVSPSPTSGLLNKLSSSWGISAVEVAWDCSGAPWARNSSPSKAVLIGERSSSVSNPPGTREGCRATLGLAGVAMYLFHEKQTSWIELSSEDACAKTPLNCSDSNVCVKHAL